MKITLPELIENKVTNGRKYHWIRLKNGEYHNSSKMLKETLEIESETNELGLQKILLLMEVLGGNITRTEFEDYLLKFSLLKASLDYSPNMSVDNLTNADEVSAALRDIEQQPYYLLARES